MKPLAIDLFCGLGGWTDGLLAEGWNVVGFDVTRHRYPARAVPECDGVKAAGEKVKLGASREKGNSRSGSFNYANECALKESPLTGGWAEYPAQLVLQDVLTIHGSQFKNADMIVASPPCQQYSWLAMPWSRSKDPNNSKAAKALRAKWESEGPDNRLFDACFRIQREAIYAKRLDLKCCELDYSKPGCKRCHIPLIVENVRGAQPWVGRSVWNYGSFHLWGNVPALMPEALKAQKSAAGHCKSAVATERPGGRMIAGDVRNADGTWTSTVETGTKFSAGTGGWFGDYKSREGRGLSQISGNSSRSTARKAASAMIAKIPLPLSTHIARVYKP